MSEILSMLAPKTSNMASVGHCTGETRKPEDVAAALSGIVNKHILYYAYVKWCGDNALFPELLKLAQDSARYKFNVKGYKKPVDQINSFARVALLSALIPRHCKACNGSGSVPNAAKNGWVDCNSCDGTGLGKDISDASFEKAIKAGHRSIKSFWRSKLNESLSEYLEWDALIDSHVKRKLK